MPNSRSVQPCRSRPRRAAPGVVLLVVLTAVLAMIGGCERKRDYSQNTPDQVLKSALEMVKQGETERLAGLLYADSPQMRAFWDETGVLLGNMQKLSKAVQARFPTEFEELRRETEERAARGEASSLLDLVRQSAPGAGGPTPPRSRPGSTGRQGEAAQRDQFRDLVNQLFADPYAWLETNSARLSAEQITDDTATILLDGQPVIPIVGLPMRLENDRWYVVMPLAVPPISEVMPRTDEQWQILRSLVRVLNKTVVDMTADVQQGRVSSMEALARNAQQKAIFPAAIAFAAYGKELDVSNRVQRRVRTFRAKFASWSQARAKLAGAERTDAAVARSFRTAVERLAPAEIEKLVRQNKPSRFDEMSDFEFEDVLAAWLRSAGLRIDLGQSLAPDRVDPIIEAWENSRRQAPSGADAPGRR